MIRLTRLDGSVVVLNCDLVESVESTPDTVVSLVNNHKLVVRDGVTEVVEKVVEFRQRTNLCPFLRERMPARLPGNATDRSIEGRS